MNKIGGPVRENLDKYKKLAEDVFGTKPISVDFSNTEVAYAHKDDKALKKMLWLFGLMNKHWLVGLGAKIGVPAIKMHLPFVKSIVKNTVFEQFCGGVSLFETQSTIDLLAKNNVFTILDYGAEGKQSEEEFNKTMNETIRAIQFAAKKEDVPVVSSKISGLARFDLLASIQAGVPLTSETKREYRNILKRLDSICNVAFQNNTAIYFDAEETWIQGALDHLVEIMMRRYNKEKVVVSTTVQLYRTEGLQLLIDSFDLAQKHNYFLGAKLVRGAYMEKERARAEEKGYPTPIHPNKEATDDCYNSALRFCIDNYERIALCNATHNAKSNYIMAKLIDERGLKRNHLHLNFSQLYGMSDNQTFNLAKAGYNVAKYVPYGPIEEVVPYLIRRAEENSSVTGDMGREYQMALAEVNRRGI
jgi:proline dehydrogenase